MIGGEHNESSSLKCNFDDVAIATYIAYDSQLCKSIQNCKPNSDIFGSFRHWPPGLAHEFVRVKSDF